MCVLAAFAEPNPDLSWAACAVLQTELYVRQRSISEPARTRAINREGEDNADSPSTSGKYVSYSVCVCVCVCVCV